MATTAETFSLSLAIIDFIIGSPKFTVDGGPRRTIMAQSVFQVPAGNTTVYLNAQTTAACEIHQIQLTMLYFPTAWGNVALSGPQVLPEIPSTDRTATDTTIRTKIEHAIAEQDLSSNR